MIEIKAPNPVQDDYLNYPTVFLAGSIEMGTAEKWQDRAVKLFEGSDIVVLNPRRDDWNNSWYQSLDCPEFVEQVKWEQDGIEYADFIIFYFDKDTQSPITLLELGQASKLKPWDTVVVCPDGYWRKGNVDVVCKENAIDQADSLEEAVAIIRDRL